MDYVKGNTVMQPERDFSRRRRLMAYGERMRKSGDKEKEKNSRKERKGNDGV